MLLLVFMLALFCVVFFSHTPLLILLSALILLVLYVCGSVQMWMDAYREERSEKRGAVFQVCVLGICHIGLLCVLFDIGLEYFLIQVTL